MSKASRIIATAVLGLVMMGTRITAAQPSPTPVAQRSEAEFLVPPQGGAFEVPLHAGAVCILSFAEKLAKQALASSPAFEIKAWGEDGVAVRAISMAAKATTLAVATSSGAVKVNLTLTVVGAEKPAYTLVRFKGVSAEEAFEAQLEAAVAKRVAPIEAELTNSRRDVEAKVRDRADGLIAERLIKRTELTVLGSHARNADHVVVHLSRAVLLGDDGYLVFSIENRSSSAYRLASVLVTAGERDVSGPARLAAQSADRDPSVIGVVPAGATSRGVVVVRSIDQILGKNLEVTFAGPKGAGAVHLDRGIVLH